MKALMADDQTGDTEARRSELERAVLNVQTERVALTESFMRMGEGGATGVAAMIVRLLRLQRAVGVAQEVSHG